MSRCSPRQMFQRIRYVEPAGHGMIASAILGRISRRWQQTSRLSLLRCDHYSVERLARRAKNVSACVLVSLVFSHCSSGKDASTATEATKPAPSRFALTITRTAGVLGTPLGDSVVVDSGQTVAYSFRSEEGFGPISVMVDGSPAPAAGTLLITTRRGLAAGATRIIVGTRADSGLASAARAVTANGDPVKSLSFLIASYDSLARVLDGAGVGEKLQQISALAFDSTISMDMLRSADAALAGRLFTIPTSSATVQSSRVSTLRLATGRPPTVPLTVLYVNGIFTSHDDYATGIIATGVLAKSVPTSDVIGIEGIYAPTMGMFYSDQKNCLWKVLRFYFRRKTDYVTNGKALNGCYGDLGQAAVDIGDILSGEGTSNVAIQVSQRIRQLLSKGRAVIVVGHSRGTLVAQEALAMLASSVPDSLDQADCVGFISVASPLWNSGIRTSDHIFGVIARGTRVADILLLPGIVRDTPKSPATATVLTAELDAKYPGLWSSLIGKDVPYEITAGLQIHHYLGHYAITPPVSGMIRGAMTSLGDAIQQSCVLRTPAAIDLVSTNNVSAPVNTAVGPIVFAVTDAAGKPVPWRTVHFSAQSGSVIAPADQTTASDGTVAVQVKLGNVAGPAVLAAGVVGSTLAPALFHIIVTAQQTSPRIALSASSASFSGTVGAANPQAQQIGVTNAGGGTLSGVAATVGYASGQPSNWLTATLSTTTAPATLTLAPVLGSLGAGTYSATVAITSTATGVTNSPQSILVNFTVASTASAPTIALSSSSLSFATTTGGASPAPQSVSITNSGSGTLSGLSSSVTYQAGQPTGWLATSLGGATSPATLTITLTTGALAAGSYGAVVSVSSTTAGVTNSPQSISVNLTVATGVATGALSIGVTGVPTPGGVSATVNATVSGPNSYSQVVSLGDNGSRTLTGLTPGNYTANWADLYLPNYLGRQVTFRAAQTTQQANVVSGATASIIGTYSVASASIGFLSSGFPAYSGSQGNGTVTGPNGFQASVSIGNVLQNMTPGSYTMSWSPIGPQLMCGRQVTMGANPASETKAIQASVSDQYFSTHYAPATGILQLTATGFPNNYPAPAPTYSATVTGPGGYSASNSYNVYDNLVPGTYTVTWANSTFQYNGQATTYHASPTTIQVLGSSLDGNGCPSAVTATGNYVP